MSGVERQTGADLLHLFTLWRQGATIVSGLGAFPPTSPVPKTLLAAECGEDCCTSLIIASSNEQLAERIVRHRKRCHG